MRRVLALLALVFFLSATPAQAQGGVHISAVRVDLWPEFDRQAVLVILHVMLAPETSLPATVEVKIPAQAEIHAVAVVNPGKGLFDENYESSVLGKWNTLTITATQLEVQVEYYDVLVKDGKTRHIAFEWPAGSAVDSLAVAFQNPTGATNLVMTPAAVQTQRDQYNLINYITAPVTLSARDSFKLTVQYDKPNDDLSVAGQPVQPSQPLGETNGRVAWSDVLPWVVGGLGLGLIVVGLVVLYSFLRGTEPRRKQRLRHPRRAAQAGTTPDENAAVYCHECGHRSQPGDTFCRTCGARLK